MTARLNHTIVWCRDKSVSAAFLADMLGLPSPKAWGPFHIVEVANDVSLDYHDIDGGRGVYWCDPDGHLLEVITRPYGSGA